MTNRYVKWTYYALNQMNLLENERKKKERHQAISMGKSLCIVCILCMFNTFSFFRSVYITFIPASPNFTFAVCHLLQSKSILFAFHAFMCVCVCHFIAIWVIIHPVVSLSCVVCVALFYIVPEQQQQQHNFIYTSRLAKISNGVIQSIYIKTASTL